MKRGFSLLLIGYAFIITGCSEGTKHEGNTITFGTSAEYPPFEYQKKGELMGFDIDLAELIGKELGKTVKFENVQFSTILPALKTHTIDAAISTINATPERKKNFNFTNPYYADAIVAVYRTAQPVKSQQALVGKKIGYQLGTTMETWLKAHAKQSDIMAINNNNQAIEALKAHHIDVVIMDSPQGAAFVKNNTGLAYTVIAQSDSPYAIALAKDSPLTADINQALKKLLANGEIDRLKTKWLEVHHE